MAYYQRIRDLREDSDKTQNEIAEKLGFKNSSAISKRLAKIKQLFTEYIY